MQNKYYVAQSDVSISKFAQSPYDIYNLGLYCTTQAAASKYLLSTSHESQAPQELFSSDTIYNIYPPSMSILYEVNDVSEIKHASTEEGRIGWAAIRPNSIQSVTLFIGADILHPAETLENVSIDKAQLYLRKRLDALRFFAERCEFTPAPAFKSSITNDVNVNKAYELAYSMNGYRYKNPAFMSLSDKVLSSMIVDCAQNLSVYTTLGVVDLHRAFESIYNASSNHLSEVQRISNAVKGGLEALSDYVLVTDYIKYQQIVENASSYLSNIFQELRNYSDSNQYVEACMACVPHKDMKEFRAAFEVAISMASDSIDKLSSDATLIAARALNATTRRFVQGAVINHDADALSTYQSLGSMLMSDIAKMETFQHKMQSLYIKMGDTRFEFDDALTSCVTNLTPGQTEELYVSAAQRYVDTGVPGNDDNSFRAYRALSTSLEMMLIPYSSSDLTGPSGLQETYNKAQYRLQSILQNELFESEYQQKYDELYSDDEEPDIDE